MKQLYITILCLSGLFQAAIAGSLSITGHTADTKLNGQKIFIKERVNKEWIAVDETTIKNNKFTFQENVIKPKIAYLIYTNAEGNKIKQAFILEQGQLAVSVTSNGDMKFSGTPQNNLLQPYKNELNIFNKKADLYFQASSKDTLQDYEHMLKRSKSDEETSNEELNIHKKYATQLINTVAGAYIFANSYYLMNTDEKLEILNKMNAQQFEIQQIKDIRTTVETEKKVAPGQYYTDITLDDPNNSARSLSHYIGKTDYVLLEFWASWCPDCMRFLPQLSAFYNKHHGAGLEIVGISLDENKSSWTSAIARHSIPWINISDLKGWKSEGAVKYAISSIPCTFLIDKSGKIVSKNPGLAQLEKILSNEK